MTAITRARSFVLAAALAGTVWGTIPLAQTIGHDHAAQAPQSAPGAITAHQKMTADKAAAEQKLDDLVLRMNTATGAGKVDAIAAVVNELVATHKRMGGMMKTDEAMKERMGGGMGMPKK